MKLTVYRQASKERDGRIFYKGEDALPYVDDDIMSVADGMGGSGAIRHTKFNRDLFDEDKLFQTLFGKGLNFFLAKKNEPLLCEYVKKSFWEFLDTKDCYFENVNNMKKSGYFGSRIASAIFLNFALNLREQLRWDFLSDGSIEQDKKDKYLDNLRNSCVDTIKNGMSKVSKNANLIYESTFCGLALFGTTLCGTITHEEEDCVHALYFIAGDSRPYMWNSDGLFIVAEDQERADGGMTNYITGNGDFDIACQYKKFAKPCILFNASDGVFDSAYFDISQMALEKLLLETIISSNTLEEVSAKLTETFLTYGTHDDSSTIAMHIFGYGDYQTLQEDAKKRLDVINNEYISQMPDLLEKNYETELQNYDEKVLQRNRQMANTLWKYESVVRYSQDVLDGKIESDENVKARFDAVNQAIASAKAKADEQLRLIADFVKLHAVLRVRIEEGISQLQIIGSGEDALAIAKKLIDLQNAENMLGSGEENSEAAEDIIAVNKLDDVRWLENSDETRKGMIEAYVALQNDVKRAEQRKETLRRDEARKIWFAECLNIEGQDAIDFAWNLGKVSEEEYGLLRTQFPKVSDDEKSILQARSEKQRELADKYDERFYSLVKKEADE